MTFKKEFCMDRHKIIEPIGVIIAAATFIFSWVLFYIDTEIFLGSFAAAVLAASLTWISYVLLRLLVLALRR